ncbi:MAG TPA: hypothetical protein VGM34_02515, partial [Chlamydiales bacterium]
MSISAAKAVKPVIYDTNVTLVAPLSSRIKEYMNARWAKFFGWAALTVATGFVSTKLAICLGLFAFFHERAAAANPAP